MFRKCMMLLVLAITGVILSLTATKSTQGQVRRDRRVTIRKPAPFVHTVIFYLKKDAPANETDTLIADTQRLLAKIPSVREIRARSSIESVGSGPADRPKVL